METRRATAAATSHLTSLPLSSWRTRSQLWTRALPREDGPSQTDDPTQLTLRGLLQYARQKDLALLFSRVGILKDILPDQGTPFTSQLLQDLYQLLQVWHLRVLVYHPQTNGFVDRFNQTLKADVVPGR